MTAVALEEAAPLADAAAAALAEAAGSGDVLIVDDNAVNRQLLTAILRREAAVLRTAADGREALAMARAQPPDLVLLDVMMPAADGFEVCAELQRDPRTAHVPIIFLSALAEAANKIRGLELGAVDYITKPFDRGEVVARVRTQLKLQRLSAGLRQAHRELQRKQARIARDLHAASHIQRSLIPAAPPEVPGVRVAWRVLPSASVGGDLLGCRVLADDTLAAFVIDVSGHGVPAAMVTVSLSQYLAPASGHLTAAGADGRAMPLAPAALLARLERDYPLQRFDTYFTMAYVLLELRTGRLRYSAAGHPPPLIVRRDGRIERLEAGGPIVGLGFELPFEEGSATLAPGERLLLYTDGLTDADGADGAAPGDEVLERDLEQTRHLPLEEACERLAAARARLVAGAEEYDDMTLLALEYTGAAREEKADGLQPATGG